MTTDPPPSHQPDPEILKASMSLLEDLDIGNHPMLGHQAEWLVDAAIQIPGLVVVASRPSQGRSAFLHHQLLRTERERTLFSPVLSTEQVVLRLLASRSGVTMNELKHRRTHLAGSRAVMDAITSLLEERLTLHGQSCPSLDTVMAEIRNQARAPGQDHDLCPLFVIDDLEALVPKEQRAASLRTLQDLAHGERCTVLVSVTLGRGPETRPDHRPLPKDVEAILLGRSIPDTTIWLYRDEVYHFNPDTRGLIEVTIKPLDAALATTVRMEFLGENLTLRSVALGSGIVMQNTAPE